VGTCERDANQAMGISRDAQQMTSMLTRTATQDTLSLRLGGLARPHVAPDKPAEVGDGVIDGRSELSPQISETAHFC
jgi:hypothetical protein